MGIKQLYKDNLRKSLNEYGDVSVMNLNSKTARRTGAYLTCLDQENLSMNHFGFRCLLSATATSQILVKYRKLFLKRIFRYLKTDEGLLYHILVLRMGLY